MAGSRERMVWEAQNVSQPYVPTGAKRNNDVKNRGDL